MGDVVDFPGDMGNAISGERSVDEVLDAAKERGLKKVVILAYTPEGHEYCDTSESDACVVSWLIQRFNHRMLIYPDQEDIE